MSVPLLSAVAPRWEAELATLLGASDRVHLVRRCADVAELVGVAAAGLAQAALVSSDFRGLDRAAVDALHEQGVVLVGVHPPGQDDAARLLRRWGVGVVLPVDHAADELDRALEEALDQGARRALPDRAPQEQDGHRRPQAPSSPTGPPEPGGPTAPDPVTGLVSLDPDAELAELHEQFDEELRLLVEETGGTGSTSTTAALEEDPDGARGEVVVVWSPHGSPGRTTVAVNLAAELADPLTPVVLVDADTYGAAIGQSLAVLDEAPGLLAAARAADQGTLDRAALARLAPEVRPGLRVLTGLPRADRWPELRDAALADVLEQCRTLAAYVVVDVAPTLEQDEELSFDTAAPRRNGATLTALEAADRVLVVGSGDPIGLQRLVRALEVLGQHCLAPRQVVVTRVRPGPVGPEPGRRIREALHRFAGADDVRLIPEDGDALDAALLHGRALVEVRPGSAARQAVRELALLLAGREARSPRRRARWWRRTPTA